jgi:dethiobiotin synthetase
LLTRLGNSFGAMANRIFFIIGTDTGVGKTVLAASLTRHLREKGLLVAALKPLCSGGRSDARILHKAAGKVLTLDEVNPWHFRAPLAPLLAARMENKRVKLREALQHIRSIGKRFETVIVEGAGGLLSPLGEKFNARDCLLALDATPILVCLNRIGAVNQVLLVVNALPAEIAKKLNIVLISLKRPNTASRSNLKLLAEFVDASRLHTFPWLADQQNFPTSSKNRNLQTCFAALLR